MRRRLVSSAVLAALTLVISGCTSTDNEAKLDGEITLGVTLERSGSAAALGLAESNALNLVVDNVNKDGVLGKKIKLIIKDNKSNGAESARLVKDLVEKDKVTGILGAGTTSTTLPFLEYVEQQKVPTVSMGGADAIVRPIDKRRYTFKTPPNGLKVVRVLMQEFAVTGASKFGVIAPNSPYGDGAIKALLEATRRTGATATGIERFEETDKDYTTQITKLVEKKPDAIVVTAIMPAAGFVAKNIKESGFQGRVYFDGGAGAELFVDGAGKAAENMYMVTSSILAANQITATTPAVLAQKEFFTAYTQRHGTFSGYASFAADALNLMVAAIRKAGSTDRQKVRDAMETLAYDGLTGSFSFSPTNHGGASGDGMTVLTVRNGGWVLAQ